MFAQVLIYQKCVWCVPICSICTKNTYTHTIPNLEIKTIDRYVSYDFIIVMIQNLKFEQQMNTFFFGFTSNQNFSFRSLSLSLSHSVCVCASVASLCEAKQLWSVSSLNEIDVTRIDVNLVMFFSHMFIVLELNECKHSLNFTVSSRVF